MKKVHYGITYDWQGHKVRVTPGAKLRWVTGATADDGRSVSVTTLDGKLVFDAFVKDLQEKF